MNRLRASSAKRRSRCLVHWSDRDGYDSLGRPVTVEGLPCTHTRNGSATVADSNGRLHTVPYGIPARHHRYVAATGIYAPVGVLLERQTTNLLLQSQTLATSWTQDAVTITSDAMVAPDGTLTADKIKEDNTNAQHLVEQSTTNAVAVYTYSHYFKAAERGYAYIAMSDAASGRASIGINLATGATWATGIAVGSWTAISSGVEVSDAGWYRGWVTATRGAGTVTIGESYISSTGAVGAYAGTTGSGIYAWGAQLEAGTLTTYKPTTTVALVRPASAFGIPASPVWQAHTTYERLVWLGGPAQNTLWIYCVSLSSFIQIKIEPTGITAVHSCAAGLVSATISQAIAFGDLVEVAVQTADDGSVRPFARINSGTLLSSAASGTAAHDTVEATSNLGVTPTSGAIALQSLKMLTGAQTLADCATAF